jgi:phosphotransferase system IIB component
MKTILTVLTILAIFISAEAQDTTSYKIVVLPFISNDIDFASVKTSESILRMEISKQISANIVSEKKTISVIGNEGCTDEECAKEIGEKLNSAEVLLCKLNPLGEKIIVQYILVETATGKNILSESATAINLEDLDAVMKRVAISVANHSPFYSNQQVGNIVGQESIENLKRASRFNFGVGFGYLFPSEGYNDDKKSFTLNIYLDYEIQDYAVGMMAGARDGFAINLYGNYLFSRTDFCPYLGGTLGFHWVAHDELLLIDPYYENGGVEKDADGIELGVNAGIRLLHTYNIQLFLNVEYIVTFNDYKDKAIVFTIGIL